MRPALKFFIALTAAVAVAGIASRGSAQQGSTQDAAREAAIAKCVKLVQEARGSGPDQEAHRVSAYKACMTAAGQRP
jgi:hypothetical protein